MIHFELVQFFYLMLSEWVMAVQIFVRAQAFGAVRKPFAPCQSERAKTR
jgi:hypothetical protein